jgi:hypothetical protein
VILVTWGPKYITVKTQDPKCPFSILSNPIFSDNPM